MTNGQSSRVIAASGTDRRIRLRRPARQMDPATADRPRHATRFHACKKYGMSRPSCRRSTARRTKKRRAPDGTRHTGIPTPAPLLPLDRCGRFGGDVVDYAVDPAHLIDDLVRDVGQELVRQVHPVGRHAVGRELRRPSRRRSSPAAGWHRPAIPYYISRQHAAHR